MLKFHTLDLMVSGLTDSEIPFLFIWLLWMSVSILQGDIQWTQTQKSDYTLFSKYILLSMNTSTLKE